MAINPTRPPCFCGADITEQQVKLYRLRGNDQDPTKCSDCDPDAWAEPTALLRDLLLKPNELKAMLTALMERGHDLHDRGRAEPAARYYALHDKVAKATS